MARFEYKVVPAPNRAVKVKGVKGTDARFANVLSTLMNEMGAQGWEYLRADTLPCEERAGLTGRTTKFQNMLIFRKLVDDAPAQTEATPAVAPVAGTPAVPLFRGGVNSGLAATAPEGDAPAVGAADDDSRDEGEKRPEVSASQS